MNQKTILILGAATVATVAATAALQAGRDRDSRPATLEERLLPGLVERVNDVRGILIETCGVLQLRESTPSVNAAVEPAAPTAPAAPSAAPPASGKLRYPPFLSQTLMSISRNVSEFQRLLLLLIHLAVSGFRKILLRSLSSNCMFKVFMSSDALGVWLAI